MVLKEPEVPSPQSRFLSLLPLTLTPSLNHHRSSMLITPLPFQGNSLFAPSLNLLSQLELLASFLIRLALEH